MSTRGRSGRRAGPGRDGGSGSSYRALTLWMWGGITGLAAILAVVVWLVWPAAPVPAQPRAQAFQDFDVCTLVDSGGVTRAPAATVWGALRPVADETRVRLSYLRVVGEQTRERAGRFVATMVRQGCDVIVAIGPAQAGAAAELATTYPNVRFVLVESDRDVEGVAVAVRCLLPMP